MVTHLVETSKTLCKVEQTWRQRGHHMETTWTPHGDKMEIKWRQNGDKMEAKRGHQFRHI